MICIYCFHGKTTITNSRGHKKEAATWRRHTCPNCGKLFSSLEKPVMSDSYTVVHSKTHKQTPYSRTQLSSSVQRAFAHVTGTKLYTTVDWLVESLEAEIIQAAHNGSLASHELAAITHAVLTRFDPIAGVQYAAQNGLVQAVNQRRRGRPSIK